MCNLVPMLYSGKKNQKKKKKELQKQLLQAPAMALPDLAKPYWNPSLVRLPISLNN